MIRQSCITALALSLTAGAALAQPPAPKNACFFVSQFENWKAGGDDKTMYIRATGRRYFRLDLANHCRELSWPGAVLVNTFRTPSICSALDFDLKVSAGAGSPAVPCIVRKLTPLSGAEVAALPAKQKP